MSKPADLLGQYISQILIPRLNRADDLFNKGRQYDALRAQLSVVRVLYRATKEDKEMLKKWIKQVEAIKNISKEVEGETGDIAAFNKERRRNHLAEEFYPELDMSIWDKLHEFKYFESGKRYGPKISEYDSEKGEEI